MTGPMAATLAVLAWACLLVALIWLAVRAYRRHVNRRVRYLADRCRARDIFTLHPGTKARICGETGQFLGYRLPSGTIVWHRYWHYLEGKRAAL